MIKKILVLMAVVVFLAAGCAPQMVMVTGKSDDLPGVVYAGAYIKHPTGMNVARIDQYKDGVLVHPGNTVCSDGLVNNASKGTVGSIAQSAGFVWGMSALRPDLTQSNVNVSGTSSTGPITTGPVTAGAAAVLKNTTDVNVKNTNFNVNPVNVKNTNFNVNKNHNKGFIPPGQDKDKK